MRMQFYAVEIARYARALRQRIGLESNGPRNRAGLNDWIYEKEHPDEK